ncbi:MAG: hypothetical protein U5K79_19300 [Cyclobacteriaceae bacterium]|nr:hypothetical protein [Cyclobacteriaceae bacterium]
MEKAKSPEMVCLLTTEKPVPQIESPNPGAARELQSQGGIACVFHPPKSL